MAREPRATGEVQLLQTCTCFAFRKITMSEPEIGTGKSVFVIAVVLGCFAILYPKVFYHMMFDDKIDKPGEKMRFSKAFFSKMKKQEQGILKPST